MLDQLDLVHMNGRIYDPLMARFLSADPLIQDPAHSQSYNRYTYVWNNPTNLTDPTGFMANDEGKDVNVEAGDKPKPVKRTVKLCEQDSRCVKINGREYRIVGFQAVSNESTTPKGSDNTGGQGANSSAANSGNIHLETAKTIGSAFVGSIANIPSDLINGAADWTERFLHRESGLFGRVGNLWDYRNPVAQDAAGDLRAVEGGLLMLTPLKAATSEIPTIGGRVPINSKYAGEAHPSGIEFNKQGFPDFGPVSKAQVRIDGLTGNYAKDAALANKAVGLSKTPSDYVWHHVEDGRTMQLVPKDVHNEVRHTGGAAVIRNEGFD